MSPMIATRAIAPSPFADDHDTVYFGGFDANQRSAHNTAWIVITPKDNARHGGSEVRVLP